MAHKRLSDDIDMIERMENDLQQKVMEALGNNPDIANLSVYGVFSLDHLESMRASELCNDIGVGVGYLSSSVGQVDITGPGNVDQGQGKGMAFFKFVIVLAVPTEESCGTRHNATKLLTLMRKGILGKPVSDDITNRCWRFISEQPEISASTKQMLYYSQMWQVSLPNLGN